MAFVIADNAKETTTTSGTGNYTSSGTAAAGYLTIAAAIGESNQSCFCVRSGSDAEIFLGTVGAGNAITRDLILSSTNGGDPVNWPDSEAKDIFCTMSAKLMVFLAAALQGGDAGKGVVVNAGGTGFELGGPFLPKAGGKLSNNLEIEVYGAENALILNGGAGNDSLINFRIGGIKRWKSGRRASGQDYVIERYSGAGEYIDTPFLVNTTTGLITIKGDPTEALGIATKQFVDSKTAAATTAALGTVELSTGAEVTSEASGVVPTADLLKYHQGIAKAWVNYDGTGTAAIRDSYNVSSLTDNGTGNHTVNLGITMANTDYAVIPGMNSPLHTIGVEIDSTSAFTIKTYHQNQVLWDESLVMAAVYGDI
ncbi:hypothetical protein FHS78_000607 [Parvibaculum indicum]|uniref:hypothetical protein n=1 Tax=Parvibaculum indicum TaxID=562969 RepID=UPI00141E2F46|nr:hypothetical protein [Parvibaculum indicum]NIJ40337.1 hypothetical protein [Parvibaculum indicum]